MIVKISQAFSQVQNGEKIGIIKKYIEGAKITMFKSKGNQKTTNRWGIMKLEIICKQCANCHFEFKDGFECAVDNDGIIWIKQNNEQFFDRPCMRYCFTEIKIRNKDIAKFILEKSCEIQDNKIITKRARGYLQEA